MAVRKSKISEPVSCSALKRHGEWLRSLIMAFQEECLLGAFASYRGFLESAADSFYSLGPVPKTIAPNVMAIVGHVRQKPARTKLVFVSKELESRLIHFPTVGNLSVVGHRLTNAQ